MKKILAILTIAFLFMSCDNPDIPKYVDRSVVYVVSFSVENASGENLLDPATVGNILDNEIYIAYQGERLGEKYENRYRVGDRPSEGFQLTIYQPGDDIPEYITGNLPALIFYMPDGFLNKIFTINWGDGTSNEFKLFPLSDDKDEKKGIDIWFNGQSYRKETGRFTIVK
jgi:hypothetical protein